jgi:hypothetical protein
VDSGIGQQGSLWTEGDDGDLQLQSALRSGRLSALCNLAGRRVLAAWEADRPDELAEALALLRDVLPNVPEGYDPTPWIEAQPWVTARSGDHQYVLIRRSTDWREQVRFLRWLRTTGFQERWGQRGETYRYKVVTTSDGRWRYWPSNADETISNRRREP